MKDETKHLIAKELFFIGKWFLIPFVPLTLFAVIALTIMGESGILGEIGSAALVGLGFVGIGYLYRLIKWIWKWK